MPQKPRRHPPRGFFMLTDRVRDGTAFYADKPGARRNGFRVRRAAACAIGFFALLSRVRDGTIFCETGRGFVKSGFYAFDWPGAFAPGFFVPLTGRGLGRNRIFLKRGGGLGAGAKKRRNPPLFYGLMGADMVS